MRADEETDRQTNEHADHNTSHPYRGRSNYCRYTGIIYDIRYRFVGLAVGPI